MVVDYWGTSKNENVCLKKFPIFISKFNLSIIFKAGVAPRLA